MSVTKLGMLLPTYKASLSQVLALHAGEILLLPQVAHCGRFWKSSHTDSLPMSVSAVAVLAGIPMSPSYSVVVSAGAFPPRQVLPPSLLLVELYRYQQNHRPASVVRPNALEIESNLTCVAAANWDCS